MEERRFLIVDDSRQGKLIARLRALGVREDNLKVEGIMRLDEDELALLEFKCDKMESKGSRFTEHRPSRHERRAQAAKSRRKK